MSMPLTEECHHISHSTAEFLNACYPVRDTQENFSLKDILAHSLPQISHFKIVFFDLTIQVT